MRFEVKISCSLAVVMVSDSCASSSHKAVSDFVDITFRHFCSDFGYRRLAFHFSAEARRIPAERLRQDIETVKAGYSDPKELTGNLTYAPDSML